MKEPRISQAKPADADFTLEVTWANGSKDIIDLGDLIHRLKVFRPLREGDLFGKVEVADYGWAVRWSDEIDCSADTLWRLAQEQSGAAMSAKQFREWRKRMNLSLSGAAEALGISRRMVAYYDSGEKPIPKAIWLATKGLEAERQTA